MAPSALPHSLMQPHAFITDVDSDLLADALFPPVEPLESESEAPTSPDSPSPAAPDSDVDDDAIVPDPIPLRQPRSQLLKRVRDGLEPQIEKWVPPYSSSILGWTPLNLCE